jgi:hypothetical protein
MDLDLDSDERLQLLLRDGACDHIIHHSVISDILIYPSQLTALSCSHKPSSSSDASNPSSFRSTIATLFAQNSGDSMLTLRSVRTSSLSETT